MMGHAILLRFLAATTYGIVWLTAACTWILLPISRELRWAGLVVIAVAIWVQHRPRRDRSGRMRA